ncbi:Carbon monoxide dehydrogenase small chain [archaeon HR01]|nr:Carbon monoxide dehydrogenase small chain [archaeon HR01]
MVNKVKVNLKLNGERFSAEIDPRMLLCDFIRDVAGLTGTHIGCMTGNCGACTVLMNGRTVKSCTILAAQANGSDITTIEGLSKGLELNPIQRAFHKRYAVQCGYCTPGMIITAHYLLSLGKTLSRQEIREHISGNLCRCTGYQNIIDAIEELLRDKGLLR